MRPDDIADLDTVCRDKQLFEAELDGDILGLSVESGFCYGFNATAAEIWRLVAIPLSVGELIERLTAEFEVSPEVCAAETRIALCQLGEDGLIKIESQAVA